jgi:adenylate cyclase
MCIEPNTAVESFAEMVRLSPLDPLSSNAWYGKAWACLHLELYDEGCLAATKAMEVGADAHALAAFIVNATLAGRRNEARTAAERLLLLEPAFRASHAAGAFPMRSPEWNRKIEESLRQAGLPQ